MQYLFSNPTARFFFWSHGSASLAGPGLRVLTRIVPRLLPEKYVMSISGSSILSNVKVIVFLHRKATALNGRVCNSKTNVFAPVESKREGL